MDKEHFFIRSLSPEDIEAMYEAFSKSFADYYVNFNLSYDQFVDKFIHKLQINYDLSAGAFLNDKLVGFLFTGLGMYNNEYAAYNGGTGVIPEFRGNTLTQKMFHFIKPGLKKEKVKKCYLEVISKNIPAIKAYSGMGFRKTKFFHCFKLPPNKSEIFNSFSNKNIQKAPNINWSEIISFADYSPSFLDSYDVLPTRLRNEKIIVYNEDKGIVGYAIYQPDTGRLSQLAVDKSYRRRKIGSSLISYIFKDCKEKKLTVLNINSEAKDMINFFKNLGFENQLDQFEMSLALKGKNLNF